jgi:hypothetical protein
MQELSDSKKIILETNLRAYFFNALVELNKKSLCPIPESIIFYSSDVLNKFSHSNNYFEMVDGKIRDKILGVKLLEATQLTREDQKRRYLEVGESSLVLCGYFSESVNKKLIDIQYYSQLGKMAYNHLNNLVPSFLDIPSFYGMVSTSFEVTVNLISIFASKSRKSVSIYDRVLNNQKVTDQEMFALGITPNRATKAS